MRHPPRPLVLPLKRQAFKRAVTNLVTNAARFGDNVVIRAAAEEYWLRIEVDDDGPGIPPSERDHVFRPFYRIDHARSDLDRLCLRVRDESVVEPAPPALLEILSTTIAGPITTKKF